MVDAAQNMELVENGETAELNALSSFGKTESIHSRNLVYIFKYFLMSLFIANTDQSKTKTRRKRQFCQPRSFLMNCSENINTMYIKENQISCATRVGFFFC